MSASREKQNRQNLANSGWVDPKIAREEEQRKKEKRSNALYGVIAALFLIAVIAAVVWRSNIIPKMATAATVDGEKYNAAEVSFYYQNAYAGVVNSLSYMASYVGLDTSTSPKNQTITEDAATMLPMMGLPAAEAGTTWYDYCLDQGLTQMATVQSALRQAEAEGFTYPASVQAQVDDQMAYWNEAAAGNNVSLDALLKNNFGTTMTESIYREQLTRLLRYDAYASAYEKNLTYTDSEIDAAYDAEPKNYDEVSYESVLISGAAESTTDADGNTVEPTEEEEAAAKEAAKEAAEQMLADYQAGEDLEALSEANEDYSYTKNEDGAVYYAGDTVLEWLFDDVRQSGDCDVLESGSNYYVIVFHDRFRDETPTIDVRHILVPLGTATLTAADEGYEDEQAQLKADAKAKADELLAQWKAGDATEDSFAQMAMEHSEDGSKYDGGLYSQVVPGQMVTAFNDWCFDASRKSGDTGVVETEYGAHVMYFVSENLPYWQSQVVAVLKNSDYVDWETAFSTDSDIQQNSFGVGFVG